MAYVCLGLYALPFGVIGRVHVYFMILSLPGHLLYYCSLPESRKM